MGEETVAGETQEAANLAEVLAVEEREPAPDQPAEREPARGANGRFVVERDPRPDPAAFDDWDSLQEAQSRWAARQEISSKGRDQLLSDRVASESYRTRLLRDQAVRAGLVEPSDEMDSKTWAEAFKARQARADGTAAPAPVGLELGEPEAESAPPEAGEADRQIVEGYNQRVASFESEHPDFRQVVSSLELGEDISRAVEPAILQEERGPEIAYFLSLFPEEAERISKMSASRAVSEVGRIAEKMDAWERGRDGLAQRHVSAGIPPAMTDEYHRRAVEMVKREAWTADERATARSLKFEPHVEAAVVALGRPEVFRHLVRNPAIVGELNYSHPLTAAGRLQALADELDRENESAKAQRRRATPIMPSTSKSSPTASGLSDSLSMEVWSQRFKKQMGYQQEG